MGDDGKRYNGVTNQVVTYMKRLCSIADVIVPNITEACFYPNTQLNTLTLNRKLK